MSECEVTCLPTSHWFGFYVLVFFIFFNKTFAPSSTWQIERVGKFCMDEYHETSHLDAKGIKTIIFVIDVFSTFVSVCVCPLLFSIPPDR